MHVEYPKIHRLGKEETDGILDGKCVIQEKIDGANISIWYENGDIKCGSKTRELTSGFNGFVDAVKQNTYLRGFFELNPEIRLYGEWLVRHSISYSDLAYKKIYLFDVVDAYGFFIPQTEVEKIAQSLGLEYPQVFGEYERPTVDMVKEYAGKTNLGTVGEGVVIKNAEFTNKFGNRCYGKYVTDKFKESNAIIFGGNNKHSESYWEMYICNKYVTLGRVQKIMQKLESEVGRLDLQYCPRIASMVLHDVLTEEVWEISKSVPKVDFKTLQRVIMKKSIQMYKDILDNNLSVAYETNNSDSRIASEREDNVGKAIR
jgi:hypothetical protein